MKKQAVVAIAIGVAFAATPIAHADGNWIAMAISDSTGQIKIADGAASQAAAEQKAMEACRKSISDCRLLASGRTGWVHRACSEQCEDQVLRRLGSDTRCGGSSGASGRRLAERSKLATATALGDPTNP